MWISDINRPDQGGVAPKMQAIADQAAAFLAGLLPVLNVNTDDNFGSAVDVSGSFDPKETWEYGIRENSRYFRARMEPKAKYYTPGDNVSVELMARSYKLPKLRKYTGTPEKCLAKLKAWIQEIAA